MQTIMKGFSGIGGFLILAIGIGMLGVTVYGFMHSELLFNEYTLLGILLASDILIILGATIGIIGIKRGSGPLICLFQVFVLIFLLMFLGIGIGAEVLPKSVFNGNCTTSNNPLIEIANKAYEISNSTLCTLDCPCGLTDDAINSGNYNDDDKFRISKMERIPGGAVRFQQCDAAKTLDQDYQNVLKILWTVEETLQCSDWCAPNDPTLVFKFSNVNSGKPAINCYDSMRINLGNYGHIIGLSAFGVATFLLLVCLCNLCICCSKENKSRPLHSRFVYNDGGYYRAV